MYLKLPVYVIIVNSFHNKPKTPSKLHIPRIFAEQLKFGLFSSKIRKIRFFCDSDVIKTSLWRQVKGYRYFLVSMERGDSYLSPSTKIIRIGGLIAKI